MSGYNSKIDEDRLVLGTVQLGMKYGIANKTGKPDYSTAKAIISKAWEYGIREFDTAQGYGDSEEILGNTLLDLGILKNARIVTKFKPDLDHLNSSVMSKEVDMSLKRLGVSSLFGIMLHREELLSIWDKGLFDILNSFVSSGKVRHLGVSVYSPDKAIAALEKDGVDFVQLPTNVLDRRFENSGVFNLADKKKKKIYIRSVFLQGLILLEPEEIPEKLAEARPIVGKFEALCKSFGISRMDAALGLLKSEFPNGKVIFGAEAPWQVEKNGKIWRNNFPARFNNILKQEFNNIDERILIPSLWR